jgi:tripartite-type tricarboxylate transporter receptor subunit TctC
MSPTPVHPALRLVAGGLAVCAAVALTACGRPTTSGGGATDGATEQWPRPGRSIELIVAFAPGGAQDTAARLVAPVLEAELGTPVEVVNRPGAGGQVGYTELTGAEPDGYTIGATGSPSVVVSPLDPARGAQYTRESFQPLGMQVVDPQVIGVAPDSPYTTLSALLDAARSAPDTITATTTGIQTGEHFAIEQIQRATGAAFAPVHFSEGNAQAVTAFLGRHVQVYVGNASEATEMTAQGQIRVLGVMDTERSAFLTDVPTFAESGFDIVATTARGYSAPAGLPEPVATKLEEAIEIAVVNPDVERRMTDLGLDTRYRSAADYRALWTEQETIYRELLPIVTQS